MELIKLITSLLFVVGVILLVFYTVFYAFVLSFVFAGFQATMIIYITLTFAAILAIKKL